MARMFPYRTDKRFLPVLIPLGLRQGTDGVTITEDGRLRAKLGWIRIETDLANVSGAHITRGYRWWTAVGVRISFADDGLTFGTNTSAGVCIHFQDKVPSASSPGRTIAPRCRRFRRFAGASRGVLVRDAAEIERAARRRAESSANGAVLRFPLRDFAAQFGIGFQPRLEIAARLRVEAIVDVGEGFGGVGAARHLTILR